MRWVFLALITGLAGCGLGDRSAEDAEAQFELASNSGTYTDVCESARRAAAAWLARHDQQKFEDWRLRRDIYCASARRDPGGMPSHRAEEEAASMQAYANEFRDSDIPELRNSAAQMERELTRNSSAAEQ